jgi:hypothetical protein
MAGSNSVSEVQAGNMALVVCHKQGTSVLDIKEIEGVLVQIGTAYYGSDGGRGYHILPVLNTRAKTGGVMANGLPFGPGQMLTIDGLPEQNLLVLPHPRNVAIYDLLNEGDAT